jgi:hypothetical protein
MKTLDPDPSLPPGTKCSWHADGSVSAAWKAQYTGSCGVAPTLVEDLPTTICTHTPAPPAPAHKVYIAGAQVAGFDTAIFGLPTDPAKSVPVIFTATDNVLISTLRISNVITARYGPIGHWEGLLGFIFDWLGTGVTLKTLVPSVRPIYAAAAALPQNSEAAAVAKAVKHLTNTSGLLYSPSISTLQALTTHCPVTAEHAALQPSVVCIDEGFSSTIDSMGRQHGETGNCPACGCIDKNSCANTRTDDNAQSAIGYDNSTPRNSSYLTLPHPTSPYLTLLSLSLTHTHAHPCCYIHTLTHAATYTSSPTLNAPRCSIGIAGQLLSNQHYTSIAVNITDYIFQFSSARQQPANKSDGSRGAPPCTYCAYEK